MKKVIVSRWKSESTKFGKFLATVPPFLITLSALSYETINKFSTLLEPDLVPKEVKVGLALLGGFSYVLGNLTKKDDN